MTKNARRPQNFGKPLLSPGNFIRDISHEMWSGGGAIKGLPKFYLCQLPCKE